MEHEGVRTVEKRGTCGVVKGGKSARQSWIRGYSCEGLFEQGRFMRRTGRFDLRNFGQAVLGEGEVSHAAASAPFFG